MIVLYLIIVIYSLNLFIYFLNNTLDSRLKHELEKITSSFVVLNDSIIVTNQLEFNESDFNVINENSFFLLIYNFDKKILLQSNNIPFFHPIELNFPSFEEKYYFIDEEVFDNFLRVSFKKLYNENGKLIGYIKLSIIKDNYQNVINNIIVLNIIIFPFAVLLIVIASFFIAKKTFAPIQKIISTAEKISVSNLNQRIKIDYDSKDELFQLINTLNLLFERLESQFKMISDFNNNASHQLMTPLTIIKNEVEYLLKIEGYNKDILKSLTDIKELTDQMIHIVRSLLLLSRDVKENIISYVSNLSNIITKKLPVFFDKNLLDLDIEENIYLRCHEEYLLIILQNVVDNALKYSNYQKVRIEAKVDGNFVIIKCIDKGIGIDSNEKNKLFERFYRSEKAEQLGIKGFGLGLSLVKFIVNTIDGEIDIKENIPNGTIVILKFPKLEIV